VHYFGYILSENGISASREKFKAIRQNPNTKCVRKVRDCLGLPFFYMRLISNFAEIAKPLSQITRKGQEFSWGPNQQKAFESLKERFCTILVLGYTNFKLFLF
jgi:hypothetical protein